MSANVEIVQIGALKGEYVSGAWTIPEVESTFETKTPDQTLPLEATWDSDASIQILRWLDKGMLFEIICAGGQPGQTAYLDKEHLIGLAESMQ
jgi:hypothetical protein